MYFKAASRNLCGTKKKGGNFENFRKLPRIIYALLKLNARKMLPHAI